MLYLCSSEGPVSAEPKNNMFFHLSRYLSGYVLAALPWRENPESVKRAGEFQAAAGVFQYCAVYKRQLPGVIGKLRLMAAYVYQGLRIRRAGGSYDVIVVYGISAITVAGYVLKLLTGRKLVVMVVLGLKEYYHDNHIAGSALLRRLANKVREAMAVLLLRGADHLYLVGSRVLDGYGIKDTKPHSAFVDFARVGTIIPSPDVSGYVLSLGGPWHRKGVDVLIKAFKLITDKHPHRKLLIVGADPDTACMELAAGANNIEFAPFCSHEEAMQYLAGCGLYVQASRNEGIARVLMEAMAMQKSIIASDVAGTADIIKDGVTGVLFESEDVEELARKMDAILGDPVRAERLADAGRKFAIDSFTGEHYAKLFSEMIDTVVDGGADDETDIALAKTHEK